MDIDERLYVARLLNEFELPADLVEVLLTIPRGAPREQWKRRLPQLAETWTALPVGVARSVADISIRGRMALGITCFERYCDAQGSRSVWLDGLVNQLWTFVETDDLAKWEDDITGMAGGTLYTGGRSCQPDDPRHALLPEPARRMLFELIEGIGRGNLYAGTAGCSMETLWATLRVLKQTMDSGVAIPDVSVYRKSPFDQAFGWGDRVPKAFFSR